MGQEKKIGQSNKVLVELCLFANRSVYGVAVGHKLDYMGTIVF